MQELQLRKIKARNLDEARAWMAGRIESEELAEVDRILSRDLGDSVMAGAGEDR